MRTRRRPQYRPMRLSRAALEALQAIDSEAARHVLPTEESRETISPDDDKPRDLPEAA